MQNRASWFRRNPKKSVLLVSILSLLIVLVLLEILFRILVYIKTGPEIEWAGVVKDKHFGWTLNIHMKPQQRFNRCNEEVVRQPPVHPLIIKFPKYIDNPKTILFTGDSYIHAHEVSTGKAFYDIFEELAKHEYTVYAAGVGGFGNLQEYLLIKAVYPEIQPDIIIWQLCANDPSNNVFELDNSSFYNNQYPRPYLNLKTGSIEIKNPGFWLFDTSHGFRYLFQKMLILDHKYNSGILRFMNSLIALDPKTVAEKTQLGLKVLDTVLHQAMIEFPNIHFIGFSTDSEFERDYQAIFVKNGAEYLPKFYERVDNIENTNCAPLDDHWNHKGNQVAGEALYQAITKLL